MAKILVVDDEPTIRELYSFIFSDAGHEVLQADNGLTALERLSSETPDFMVLDVSMPGMTGREFIEELSRKGRMDPRLLRIPFCVMTGENFMDPQLNSAFARMPGFSCFFPKMIPPETVLAKVEEELAKSA